VVGKWKGAGLSSEQATSFTAGCSRHPTPAHVLPANQKKKKISNLSKSILPDYNQKVGLGAVLSEYSLSTPCFMDS
jgi:hypothetical protein